MKDEAFGPSRIVFLSVPASLKEDIKNYLIRAVKMGDEDSGYEEEILPEDGFVIDETIPLPLEIEAGQESDKDGRLSWEMIVSAMIKIVAEPAEYGLDSERVDYYRRFVLALKPDIFNELSGAALIKAGNGDFDIALEIISLLEGLFSSKPELLLEKALILEDMAEAQGNWEGRDKNDEIYEKLYETYERVLSAEDVPPEGLFRAACFYLKRREYSLAKDCFSGYIALSDDDEQREFALSVIKDIESRDLDDEDFTDAMALMRSGEDGKGLLKIKSFLERHPTVWNGWFVLGWALRKLGRFSDSLESFKKAVELGGGNSDTRNEMAICLMETGNLDGARCELEVALREDPENTKIISNLGVLALKAGDNDLAAGFFRTVLELDPEDKIAGDYFSGR